MARSIKSGPVTPADRLRELLSLSEDRVVSPERGGGVAELFRWLDEIHRLWPELETGGADLRAEQTRWESLQSQMRQRRRHLLGAWRQQTASLAAARQAVAPEESRWWWWLDQVAADARRRRARRTLFAVAAVAATGLLVILLLQRLFPVDPQVREAHRLQLMVEDAALEEDLDAARLYLDQALAIAPQDSYLHLQQGVVAEIQGDAAAAEQAWRAARALLADEALLLIQRGRAYLQFGQVDQALADEQAAVALDPQSALAHLFLGTALEISGDVDGALAAYGQAAALAEKKDPQIVVIARTRMGALMQQLGFPSLPGTAP